MKAPMTKTRGGPIGWGRHWMWACVLVTWCLLPAVAHAQGSIFGTVQNANLTNPPATDLFWVGFLDHTDEEIRIELNTGAGYDGANWFDDFQNYTTRAAGNPYDYFFTNVTNGQGFHLTKPIPSNSFQQENILLATMTFPARPTGLVARVASASRINLSWNHQSGVTYHVYRRATSNNGTYRRLDDPAGNLTNAGVADSFFVDATSDGVSDYTYVIIGQNALGNLSAHSLTISALASAFVAPTITAAVPDSGPTIGGTVITIRGTNFDVAGATVTIGTSPATGVSVLSPFALTCTVPSAGASGPVNVVVKNTASGLASAPLVNGFRYVINSRPVWDAIGAKSVAEGANLTFRVHATDPDLTIPALSAVNVPANAVFVDSGNGAGSFLFNPNYTQAGVYNVRFIASDGVLADSQTVAITVTNTNRKPVLDVIGAKTVAEGSNLAFRVHATDPDLTTPTLSAISVPLNAAFVDSGNGAGSFTFNPNYTQAGVYNVTFIASDGSLADSQIVAVTVTNTNQKPVWDAIGSKSVFEGQTLAFRTHAVDPDGTTPSLAAINVPLNATFVDSGNGAGSFTFTPNFTQAGLYHVTFIAGDGSLADSAQVAITVLNSGSLPPVLDPIGPKTVAEAGNLSFRTHATDPDGTIPVLSAVGMPANATFVDSSNGAGGFVFNPDYTQAGIHNVTFIATVGAFADSEIVAITVINVNRPPVLAPIGAKAIGQGNTLRVQVTASDPDLTTPVLTAVNLPLNATFTDSLNGRGGFVFTPSFVQSGAYQVTFIASDGTAADSEVVTITVTTGQGNLPPVFDPLPMQTVNEGETLLVRIHAVDPEGGPVILGLQQALKNASFVDSGNGAGLFRFMPDYFQAGVDTANILAIDYGVPIASSTLKLAITIQDKNLAPSLNPIGNQSVLAGDSLKLRIVATDSTAAPGGLLFMSALNLPTNATFQDSGGGIGKFKFKPTFQQVGSYNVTFVATDNGTPALAALRLVTITVQSVNRPPVLAPISPKSLSEGASIQFNVTATDPDGTIPFLRVDSLPKNATFVDSGDGVGTFSFHPNYNQSGLYLVKFSASDGIASVSEQVLIQVLDAGNQAPILQPIGPLTVVEKSPLVVVIGGSDPDGQTVHLAVDTLIENATFVDSGDGIGVFRITPQYWQQGVYPLRFSVSDGTLADTEVVTLTILDVGNQLPLFAPVTAQTVQETHILFYTVSVVDSDRAARPTLLARPLPSWAAFADSANGKGTLTFAPGYTDSGSYSIYVVANDMDTPGTRDSVLVPLHVTDLNRVPAITQTSWGLGTIFLMGGQDTAKVWLRATDPDGPIPRIIVTSPLEAGMVFVDSGNGVASLIYVPPLNSNGAHNVLFRPIDRIYTADTGAVYTAGFSVGFHNIPPVLDSIGPKSVVEGTNLQFDVTASDANLNSPPVMTVTGLPSGANFTFVSIVASTTRYHFSWTPTYVQSGVYSVFFRVNDPQDAIDTERVTITVIDAGDQRPHWVTTFRTDTVKVSVYGGGKDSIHVRATDPDNTILFLTVPNRPRNSVFTDSGNGGGFFRFTPDSTQKDSVYLVRFIVSDGTLADTAHVTYKMIAFTRGDVNNDGNRDVFDVLYLINYVFSNGPAPKPVTESGNVNADPNHLVDVFDVTYLIQYVFNSGPAPPP